MKNNISILVSFLIILTFSAQAQKSKSIVLQLNNTSYLTDNHQFATNNNSIFDVGRLVQTGKSDIGYTIVFNDTLKVTKAQSYSLTSKELEVNSICFDKNNNYYLLLDGRTENTVHIVKYNSSHVLQWKKEYTGEPIYSPILRYNAKNDHLYIGAAISVTNGYTAFVVKIKTDGSVVSAKTISKEDKYSYVDGFTIDINGDLIFCGGTQAYNTSNKNDFYLIKLDKDLGHKWIKTFSGKNYCSFKSITTDASNNIYLCGKYNFIQTIVKTNSNGIIQKVKTISDNLSSSNSISMRNDTIVVSYPYREAVLFDKDLNYISSFLQSAYDFQDIRTTKSFVKDNGVIHTSKSFGEKPYCLQYTIHNPKYKKGCKSTDKSLSIANHTFTESNETIYTKNYTITAKNSSLSVNIITVTSKTHCIGGCDVKPSANFDYTVTGNILDATNKSIAANKYKWKITGPNGFLNTGTNENFTNIYFGDDGTYSLCLKAYSSCNDSSEKCTSIVYSCKKPVSDFTTFNSGLNTVSFVNKSTGGQTFNWAFGDGTNSTSDKDTVANVYDNDNKVNVCLTSTNGCGTHKVCKDVKPKCETIADFTFTQNEAKVTFSDKSNWANDWAWKFGDGNTSTVKNPVHNYKKTGEFNVCLITKNTCGTSTEVCKKVNIKSLSISNISYQKLTVYPNPATTMLNINSEVDFASFKIYNMSGVLINAGTLEEKTIHINDLSIGLYTIQLTNQNNTIYYTKFIKSQ